MDLALFGDGYVEAQSLRMHVKYSNEHRDRECIVLVHGLGLSCRYMLPTAEALLGEYAVVIPDLPGFGDSAKPARVLDIEALADSLIAFIEVLRLPTPPALLGNSLGCQIIAAALERAPQLARAAILQGPTTPPEERSIVWQVLRWRQNLCHDPADMRTIARDDYEKCGRWRVWKTFFHALKDGIETRAQRIRQPVLIVRGEHDPICRLEWALQLADALPNGRFAQLPNVAHTTVFTAPRALAKTTFDFLNGCRTENA